MKLIVKMKISQVYKVLILSVLLGFVNKSNAQNLKADMEKVYAAYDGIDKFYARVVSKEFEGSGVPEVTTSNIWMNGEDYFYQIGTMMILLNENYLININHREKTIMCTTDPHRDETDALVYQLKPNLDSLIKSFDKTIFIDVADGLKHYQVERKSGNITKIDFFIDEKTWLLKKIIYTYNEELHGKSWTEMSFPQLNTKPIFQTDRFNEIKYIKKVGKQLQPADKYKNYQLILTR